jgi:hypothetical protein
MKNLKIAFWNIFFDAYDEFTAYKSLIQWSKGTETKY